MSNTDLLKAAALITATALAIGAMAEVGRLLIQLAFIAWFQ